MTRGLRGSGARSASRDLSSMLTPIVRTALGAQRGLSLAAVARIAAHADSARFAATCAVMAAVRAASSAAVVDVSWPATIVSRVPRALADAAAQCAGFDTQDLAARADTDPIRRLPLYCAERRLHAGAAARRSVAASSRYGRRAAGREVAGCGSAATGWATSRCAMTLPRRDTPANASTTPCSIRMTSLRTPTTRESAATVPRSAGNGAQRMRRTSCAMPHSA
ncbi:hypothetical protein [Burkholderia anthina]|uniref:Uncharacterized protein n=1 Tax=Burkholderia anthina TaxID=179879 RepID=A0ABS2B1Y0_9BURK|nr:hypothetical protein [Burkholderia anthina]MBM2766990.1 hypothetical protein [Burkholderia anthina]